MKIVSLLPSATEIVFALGLGDQLAGRSFECEHPAEARSVPVVSGTALPSDAPLSAQQVDEEVRARLAAGQSIYTLDDACIRAMAPGRPRAWRAEGSGWSAPVGCEGKTCWRGLGIGLRQRP